MHNRPVQIIAAIIVLLLAGAVTWSIVSGPGRPRILPEGTQTLTGTLIPAELSLTRRGTHMLKVDDEEVTYVESSSVSLRVYELTEVGITGTFQHNTNPSDLPVFVVSSIRAVEIPARSVDLPSVGLTLRVPDAWTLQQFDDGVAFSLTGSSTPLLRIARSALTRLPAGTPMFIGGYDAVRIEGDDGAQTVHIEGGRTIVTFTWSGNSEHAPAFAQLLRTAIVRAASSSKAMTGAVLSASSRSAARSSIGGSVGSQASLKPQPCGGPAGVLCPAGSFCSVNSPDGVGTCVPLN